MIILVTGGTGFIGSNLCSELVKNEKNHVIYLGFSCTALTYTALNIYLFIITIGIMYLYLL